MQQTQRAGKHVDDTKLDLFLLLNEKVTLFLTQPYGVVMQEQSKWVLRLTQVKTALSFWARSQNMSHKNCP